jgi:uncharacterized FlaG/YvyC family protein
MDERDTQATRADIQDLRTDLNERVEILRTEVNHNYNGNLSVE